MPLDKESSDKEKEQYILETIGYIALTFQTLADRLIKIIDILKE